MKALFLLALIGFFIFPRIILAAEIKTPENTKVYTSTTKGIDYYHIEYTLTPENTLLTLDAYSKYAPSRYEFTPEGQFEVFIPKEMFPIPAPNCSSHIILRMPATLGNVPNRKQYLAEKKELFNRIKEMKESGKGSIRVVIELSPYTKVIGKDPLILELEKFCNVYFRNAHGRYVDYVGQLKSKGHE